MRIRPKLPSQPQWDSRFEGWAAKFIAHNMWRCEGSDPHEKFKDLMQDAYITFRYVLASYPLITEPNHIMSLFQRTMINEYHDKAKDWGRKRSTEVSLETIIGEDLRIIDRLGEENNEGLLRIILSELPPEVRAVLDVFEDTEKLALLRRKKIKNRLALLSGFPEKRDSLNEILCRILRQPKNTDLLGILKSALSK